MLYVYEWVNIPYKKYNNHSYTSMLDINEQTTNKIDIFM